MSACSRIVSESTESTAITDWAFPRAASQAARSGKERTGSAWCSQTVESSPDESAAAMPAVSRPGSPTVA